MDENCIIIVDNMGDIKRLVDGYDDDADKEVVHKIKEDSEGF